MCIVHQRVVVTGAGTLPGQHHIVGVALVTKDNGVIGIYGSLIGDPQSAVGEAGVDHGDTGVNCLGGVDLGKASGGHFDGHNMGALGCIGVLDGEVAVRFLPGGHKVGAVFVREELQNHIVLVVADAGGEGIHEGITGEVSACGADAWEGGDNLVVDHVTGGGSAGVGIAVGDIGGSTTVSPAIPT